MLQIVDVYCYKCICLSRKIANLWCFSWADNWTLLCQSKKKQKKKQLQWRNLRDKPHVCTINVIKVLKQSKTLCVVVFTIVFSAKAEAVAGKLIYLFKLSYWKRLFLFLFFFSPTSCFADAELCWINWHDNDSSIKPTDIRTDSNSQRPLENTVTTMKKKSERTACSFKIDFKFLQLFTPHCQTSSHTSHFLSLQPVQRCLPQPHWLTMTHWQSAPRPCVGPKHRQNGYQRDSQTEGTIGEKRESKRFSTAPPPPPTAAAQLHRLEPICPFTSRRDCSGRHDWTHAIVHINR